MNSNQQEIEQFKQFFKSICQSKYAQGATLMEVFMALNNPNVTMKQIQDNLDVLYVQGFCQMLQEGNELSPRFRYLEPVMASSSASTNNVPNNDFFNQYFQTSLKSTDEMKQSFQQMLAINQQMLSQQQEILQALKQNTNQVVNLSSLTTKVPIKTIDSEEGSNISTNVNIPANLNIIDKQTTVKVKSFSGPEYYDVNLTEKTCNCPNFQHVQSQAKPPGQCKHLKAVFDNQGAIQAAMS